MSKRVERVFWAITAILLGIYGLSIAETSLYQTYLNWEFAQTLKPPAHARPSGISLSAGKDRAKVIEGQPIGRLNIPAINLSAMVAEGVETSTLRRSIGHVPGTSLPGAPGNVAISAHRDTFFRHLGELQKGDQISFSTLDGTFDYAVESTSIVDPDERVVLRDIGRPTLTRITCYPFHFVGSASKRFVVHAGLVAY
jgi:LPXTG-site transpeptidase (sortase) family protein